MAIRKSNDIENESDSKYNKVKDAKSREKINKRFNSDTHNPYPGDEALQYLAKKIDDVIDETNKGTVASGSYAGDIRILKTASGSFSTRVTANDAKTGFVTTMPTATNGHTVSLSVTNNKGTYALIFTMVDSTGKSPVTKTAEVALG